ncbi:MAG: hypothetical protein WBL65_14640 [Bryobacteraceae bacterium]
MVHADGFVARELEPPVDLLALERSRLLLRHADEYDPVADATLPPNPIGDIVLPFLVADLGHQQNPLLPGITPTLALALHWCAGSGRLISHGAYPGIGASGIPYKVIQLSYPAHAL